MIKVFMQAEYKFMHKVYLFKINNDFRFIFKKILSSDRSLGLHKVMNAQNINRLQLNVCSLKTNCIKIISDSGAKGI